MTRTRSRRAAARAGHDPAGALVEPHSGHCRRLRPARGGGLRDSGAGESEAVLLLVARVVPVLHEPGSRRALFRADPVRGPGRLGGRAATDRGDGLLHDSRDGDPVRAGGASACTISTNGPTPTRRSTTRCLRWKSPYLNVPFFLIRAALFFGIWSFIAIVYSRGSRGQDATGDHAVSARLRKFAGPAIIVMALTQTLRLDRLDHVAHAALVLDDVRRLFLRGLLGGVHRAALGRRAGDARGGVAGHGHQPGAPAGHRKVPVRIHGVLGLHRLLPVLPRCGTGTCRRRRSSTRRGWRGPG